MTEIQNLNLLLHMIDAASMQLSTVKDSKLIQQKGKERLNMYFKFARLFTKEVENLVPETRREDYNDKTAFVYELLKAGATTKEPAQLLALIESFKQGEVIVLDTLKKQNHE